MAAEANHEPNRRRQQRLDAAFDALNDAAARRPVNRWPCRLDIARVQRWCAARVPEHARHQVRVECADRPATPHHRRAARPLARGLRARMDQLPDRPPALHRRRPSPGPCTGATATYDSTSTTYSPPTHDRRPTHRDRPRPNRHLLGLTAPRHPTQPLRRGQLEPSQWGQFKLTAPRNGLVGVLPAPATLLVQRPPRQANVLAALPKSAHSGALAAMREISIDYDRQVPKRSPRSSLTPMSSRRSTSTRPSLGSPQNHQPHRVNLATVRWRWRARTAPWSMVTISSPWRHTAWQCRRGTHVAGSCCAGCAAGWRCLAVRTIRPGGWRSSFGCHPHWPC